MPTDSVDAISLSLGVEPNSDLPRKKVRKSNYIRSKQRLRARELRQQHGEGEEELAPLEIAHNLED